MATRPKASRDRDAIEGYWRAKANFCLATGISPSEYDRMTLGEIYEFTLEHNRNATKQQQH